MTVLADLENELARQRDGERRAESNSEQPGAQRDARLDEARKLDGKLRTLVRTAQQAEAELARALREMADRGLYRYLGYPRIQAYAEAVLGIPGGKAKALVELARKLDRLPRLRAAFEAGEISWTKARTVTRAATPETEERWIGKALELTNRRLEISVAQANGEEPEFAVTMRFKASELADLEEGVRRLREERSEAVALGAAVAEFVRRAYAPPVSRPPVQIVIHECPRCKEATRETRDGPIPVSPEELAAAKEDAEILDLRKERPRRTKTIPPRVRAIVLARDRNRCRICGSTTWKQIHHLDPSRNDPDALILVCWTCHHKLIHGEYVFVRGSGGELTFQLADGSPLVPAGGEGSRAPPRG